MKTFHHAKKIQQQALQWRYEGKTIGFVPTMGALHRGHLELIRRARKDNDFVIVSIYVNPTQFNQKLDFQHYPRTEKQDASLCRKEKVDALFLPSDLYTSDFSTWVEETECSQGRCGTSRPGHFRGVTTVVLKLLLLTQPHRIYLGEKDAQQLDVICRMVRDLHVPVQVVPCPIVRDSDGLALSSRNARLSSEEKENARALSQGLKKAIQQPHPTQWLHRYLTQAPGLRVDYVEEVGSVLCAAAFIGQVRLIDCHKIPKKRKLLP